MISSLLVQRPDLGLSIAKKEERRRSHGRNLASETETNPRQRDPDRTLDELKLGLRFFNFLACTEDSTTDGAVLRLDPRLVKSNLFSPVSIMYRQRGLDGVLVFRSMTKVGDYHALFSAAQDVAECLDKSQKNLLTIWTIKAIVANDLFTDDNFMCNKDCASVLQRELLESNVPDTT
ncbi:hypothetical protein Bca52824_049063 [Brassica carinata]|uniref:Uncharacterized protein n=1 Tax=Brassica carinata TaxID=52824 RepID=A0A8X7RHY3_BRACI|nr:hypothetical protein Bca52824_049063 [Brassica carinata]